jgi:hypothetical protein
MSGSTGQCLIGTFSPIFVHDFGHILLTDAQLISFFFYCIHNFEGGHFYAIGSCVHHLIAVFRLWGLNLKHRPILAKEFDSAPIHSPPPSFSLGPSIGIRVG